MPSIRDIRAAAADRLERNAEAEADAYRYFRAWQLESTEAGRKAVADEVPKAMKKYFTRLISEAGDDETEVGGKKSDSKLVKKVRQLKADGKSRDQIEKILLKKDKSMKNAKAIDEATKVVFGKKGK